MIHTIQNFVKDH